MVLNNVGCLAARELVWSRRNSVDQLIKSCQQLQINQEDGGSEEAGETDVAMSVKRAGGQRETCESKELKIWRDGWWFDEASPKQ